METQKIINLLNDSNNEESRFTTKKWYVIDSQTTKGTYRQADAIKFETETIKSSLCDYFDAIRILSLVIVIIVISHRKCNSKCRQ